MGVRIFDGDVGRRQFHLTGRANGDDAVFFICAFADGGDNVKISLADKFLFFLDSHPIFGNQQGVPGIAFGQSLDDQGLAPQFCQHLGRGAAAVCLLDGPGKRALGADGKTAGIGGNRTGEQARGNDEFIFSTQRMTGGLHLVGNNGRGQAATSKSQPFVRHRFSACCQVCHIDAVNFFSHGLSSSVYFCVFLMDLMCLCSKHLGLNVCFGSHIRFRGRPVDKLFGDPHNIAIILLALWTDGFGLVPVHDDLTGRFSVFIDRSHLPTAAVKPDHRHSDCLRTAL